MEEALRGWESFISGSETATPSTFGFIGRVFGLLSRHAYSNAGP